MTRALATVGIALAISCLACGAPDSPEAVRGAPDLSSAYILDPSRVPEPLRHLVPLAAQWGIGDDAARMEYIERSSTAEREALADALAPYQAEITAWLDSFEPGAMSNEAAAFMYTQLALEEMQ